MILIVESGSSKADWVVLNGGVNVLSFKTKGWNPMFLSRDEMIVRLASYVQLETINEQIKELHFYAPGISDLESKNQLQLLLERQFVNADVFVESDMLAAARAVYDEVPLFVSILGTGSNTAFFDGYELEQFTPSLGYILGDEGSGASLGKVLLRDYLYHSLPKDLYIEFSKDYSISKELVFKSVYKEPHANRFLASYVPFLVLHKEHDYVKSLVKKEFSIFIETHLKTNPLVYDYPIAFVGSVAYYFREILEELCSLLNLKFAKVVQSPVIGLSTYHLNHK